MDPFVNVLLIALLPVAGSVAGASIAEIWAVPRWLIGAALHMAMGVAIGIVSIEFMPRTLSTTPTWIVAILFSAGAFLSVLLSWAVLWLRGSGEGAGKWQVYSTTLVDVLSDGLMTGATFAVSQGLGLLLGLSQIVGNMPGGFATGANFRLQGLDRKWRLVAAASYLIPAVGGAAGGFLLLSGAGDSERNAVLALVAGVLLVTTVEELVPEADRPGTRRWISTSGFVLGFVFVAILSAYFE